MLRKINKTRMKKLIKEPAKNEAKQLTRMSFDEVYKFVGKEKIGAYNPGEFEDETCYLEIKNPKGIVTAKETDWIVKGPAGKLYIFDSNYYDCNISELIGDGVVKRQ